LNKKLRQVLGVEIERNWMDLIETLQYLINSNKDLLIGLEWQSTHERELGIQIWGFPNLCLKILMKN
jgi:hypothetical protein